MSILNLYEIENIRRDTSLVVDYYNIRKDDFIKLTGNANWSIKAYQAAWSVYVAHQMAEYGNGPPTLNVDVLLNSSTLMCSQFSTLAINLYGEFQENANEMQIIGWDESVIGDHSQILFDDGSSKILMDPTVCLYVDDMDLKTLFSDGSNPEYYSLNKNETISWYSQNIIKAIEDSKFEIWDLIYSVDGLDRWTTGEYTNYVEAFEIDSGENVIIGSKYSEKIEGGDKNDYIFGKDGNDTIRGGNGTDIMYGGNGNDTYFVNDFRETVSEALNPLVNTYSSGIDKIYSIVSYRMPNFVESMTLLGNRNINAIGNDLNNVIFGNDSDNTIRGLNGSDRLVGLGGVDQIYGGIDGVKDIFIYNNASESVMHKHDKIYDFVSGVDKIDLSRIDANEITSIKESLRFTGNQPDSYSVWFKDVGPDVFIHADVNGDSFRDLSIQIMNCSTLNNGDFIL